MARSAGSRRPSSARWPSAASRPAWPSPPASRRHPEIAAAGHALLAFFSTSRRTYGFLFESASVTPIGKCGPGNRRSEAGAGSVAGDGQYERNKELTLKELAEEQWNRRPRTAGPAAEGLDGRFRPAFDELVIVPDGVLWYVPFEALQVQVDEQYQSLLSRFRIRYVPLRRWRVPSQQGASRRAAPAVVVGQLVLPRQRSRPRHASSLWPGCYPAAWPCRVRCRPRRPSTARCSTGWWCWTICAGRAEPPTAGRRCRWTAARREHAGRMDAAALWRPARVDLPRLPHRGRKCAETGQHGHRRATTSSFRCAG